MNLYDTHRIARCYPLRNSILHVPNNSELLCNTEMDNKETRRQHLLLAISDAGNSIEELASRTGTNPKHLSQLKNGTRKIGDKFRAKMEEALGLPIGAWDQPIAVVDGEMRAYLPPPHIPLTAHAVMEVSTYTMPEEMRPHMEALMRLWAAGKLSERRMRLLVELASPDDTKEASED